MPILSRDVPYDVEREIVYLERPQGAASTPFAVQIRPRALDALFEGSPTPGSVACVACDLINLEGRAHAGAGVHVWLHDEAGGIVEWTAQGAQIELLRALAGYMSSPETPSPVDVAAWEMKDDTTQFLKAYYMRHCTIVSYDDIGLSIDDLEGDDPEARPYGPSLSEIMGKAYACGSLSNHVKLTLQPLIESDLAFHTHIINQETGFLFRSV